MGSNLSRSLPLTAGVTDGQTDIRMLLWAFCIKLNNFKAEFGMAINIFCYDRDKILLIRLSWHRRCKEISYLYHLSTSPYSSFNLCSTPVCNILLVDRLHHLVWPSWHPGILPKRSPLPVTDGSNMNWLVVIVLVNITENRNTNEKYTFQIGIRKTSFSEFSDQIVFKVRTYYQVHQSIAWVGNRKTHLDFMWWMQDVGRCSPEEIAC